MKQKYSQSDTVSDPKPIGQEQEEQVPAVERQNHSAQVPVAAAIDPKKLEATVAQAIEGSVGQSVRQAIEDVEFYKKLRTVILQALESDANGDYKAALTAESSELKSVLKDELSGAMQSLKACVEKVRKAVVETVQQKVSVTPVATPLSEKAVTECIEETQKALSRDIGVSQTKLSTEISKIQGSLNNIGLNIGNIGSITDSVSKAIETTVQTKLDNDALVGKVSEKLSTDFKEVCDEVETCKTWVRDNGDRISNAAITAIFVVCCLFAGVCSVAAYLMMPQSVAMAGIIVPAILTVGLIIVNWIAAEENLYDNKLWRPIYNSICFAVSIGAMVLGMCALFC